MKIIFDSTIQQMPGDTVRISQILDQLGIHPAEVIVSRNGTLVPEDVTAGGNDEIRIIRIAHGG